MSDGKKGLTWAVLLTSAVWLILGFVFWLVFINADDNPADDVPAVEKGESETALPLEATFDEVRAGARLTMTYNAKDNVFEGEVVNTTDRTLRRVRVEIHLSNGDELGPTTPLDMGPGERTAIRLSAADKTFTGWSAHVEVGGGDSEDSEHGPAGESGESAPPQQPGGGAAEDQAAPAAANPDNRATAGGAEEPGGGQAADPPPADTQTEASIPITYQPKGRDLTLTQNEAATRVGPISFTTNRGVEAVSITTRANYADMKVWHYVISERYMECPSLFETDLIATSPHILRKGEIGKTGPRQAHMNVPAEFFDKWLCVRGIEEGPREDYSYRSLRI